MLAKTPDTVTRQIAVVYGASGSGQAMLTVLQQLLRSDTPFELHGLFIEDVDLQRAAALPFTKELCRLTLSVRDIPSTGFDRTIALRLRSARHAIEELARHMGISHTFQNTQGSTVGLLQDMAHSADITIFEPLRKLPTPAVHRFMSGRLMPRRIVVVIDDMVSGDEALLVASRLVQDHAERMTVLLRAENPGELQALEHMVHEFLPTKAARLLLMPDRKTQHLITTVLAERADMLVIGAREELLKSRSLGLLLQQLECPICLVRQIDSNNHPTT